MSPLTKAVNKQLLPIYDKPLIFYPLSVLMLSGIRDILIIVNKGQLNQFKKILPNGNNLGIKISYAEQDRPKGLPDAFIVGKNFIGKNSVALILGDNFFYGESLTKKLKKCVKLNNGAKVILHWVSNPSSYGVAKINNKNNIVKIIEKPKKNFSNLAVTGLYFFDNKVIKYCENLKPSKRNEIEIVDLLNKYNKKKKLSAEFLGRGGAWLDTGSIKDFYNASAFVSALEKRQGLKIACLEEIAFNNKWIKKENIVEAIKFYGKCNYSSYLSALIKKNILKR
jgi:glucose-1-phosphate thymidylyltransferase